MKYLMMHVISIFVQDAVHRINQALRASEDMKDALKEKAAMAEAHGAEITATEIATAIITVVIMMNEASEMITDPEEDVSEISAAQAMTDVQEKTELTAHIIHLIPIQVEASDHSILQKKEKEAKAMRHFPVFQVSVRDSEARHPVTV